MRLLRLRLKNIASLKGEHLIDFEEIQKESPLFAITGETGSGKSSILNSLGLALYGQIYKKNTTQLDIVTLGEKEGSIELIFQVKGNIYLADWKAKVRKQNGELFATPQTPQRVLYQLESANFDSSKKVSNKTSSELLNLDFDQFCKCIILNQGEFAKFLTSSFTERKEILEKLYPGELLESIGQELKTELDTLNNAKKEIEIKLEELQLDTISGEDLKKQKTSSEKELMSLESYYKNLESLNYHFVGLKNYHDKLIQNQSKKDSLKKELAEGTTRLNFLLKDGESLFNKYEESKSKLEKDLPILQNLLKKEETLRLLEEKSAGVKTNLNTNSKVLLAIEEKLIAISDDEKKYEGNLKEVKSLINLSIEGLRQARTKFDPFFDLYTELELLSEEVKNKKERLSELEILGKDQKIRFEEIQKEITKIPSGISESEKELTQKRLFLSLKHDERQRLSIQREELKKTIQITKNDIQKYEERISSLEKIILETSQEILPLEITLEFQEALLSVQTCIKHVINNKLQSCPVCDESLSEEKLQSLKKKLSTDNLHLIRQKYDDGQKILGQNSYDKELLNKTLMSEKISLRTKEDELALLDLKFEEKIPVLSEIDQELEDLKKKVWELQSLQKELDLKTKDLEKTRALFSKVKTELTLRETEFLNKTEILNKLKNDLKGIITEINKEAIKDLKNEIKNFNIYLDFENILNSTHKEKDHLLEQKNRLIQEILILEKQLFDNDTHIQKIKTELSAGLAGEKASDLIQKLTSSAKEAAQIWTLQVEAQKKIELSLKDSQGRLYQLNDLTRDLEAQFHLEIINVKNHATDNTHQELSKLKNIELDQHSSSELLISFQDIITSEKESFKNQVNSCRMNLASIDTKIQEWERRQDKIGILELKNKETLNSLSRKNRLFEVIGKDELRTFVLSLVEQNLIHQTNNELQKLCQGRYEIVHQTKSLKMTPEFFILDKFREGGRRKVSTLSGGETFMVSLAMALGLAEMTRGQAEIDSLFIDEGFGTLDEESLEDVLDMLQQIQNRGQMVGVISHIKKLTQTLPVNIHVSKKSDGTSSVRLVREFN